MSWDSPGTERKSAAARALANIRAVAGSELTARSKVRYLIDGFSRTLWWYRRTKIREYRLTGGQVVHLRDASMDWSVLKEIFVERVYDAHAAAILDKSIPFSTPFVLIDLGANVGLSAVALARALRPARIVVVEPEDGNFSMLEENLRLSGLTDRSIALHGFAGAEPGFAEVYDPGYGTWGIRMGRPCASGTRIFPIESIVERAGMSGYVILKCDIEGSERQLFEHLRTWEHLVNFIILELHTEFLPAAALGAYLESSRFEWQINGEMPPGAVIAVVSIERVREKSEAVALAAGE